MSEKGKLEGKRMITGVSRNKTSTDQLAALGGKEHLEGKQKLLICTGGGPGFMEAANKGAASIEGSRNMGMGKIMIKPYTIC